MAILPDRKVELNLKQKVAVAQSHYSSKGGRGELMLSKLPQTPQGIKEGTTAFVIDPLRGVQKIHTWEKKKCHEVFLFGPIKNRDRELIARYFGFDKNQNQQLTVTEKLGPFDIKRNYFVTT